MQAPLWREHPRDRGTEEREEQKGSHQDPGTPQETEEDVTKVAQRVQSRLASEVPPQ